MLQDAHFFRWFKLKRENQDAGLHAPLPIPKIPWVDIPMYFVLGLTKTMRGLIEQIQQKVSVGRILGSSSGKMKHVPLGRLVSTFAVSLIRHVFSLGLHMTF